MAAQRVLIAPVQVGVRVFFFFFFNYVCSIFFMAHSMHDLTA